VIAAVLGLGSLVLAWWLVREYRLRQARLRRISPQEAA
jgi:hypothetical protein